MACKSSSELGNTESKVNNRTSVIEFSSLRVTIFIPQDPPDGKYC